jgi:hypothetical protein
VIGKDSLRDTIGAIHEGRVMDLAVTHVRVSRQGSTVTVEAILDKHGQPNIDDWQKAEEEMSQYETDPSVTHYHLIAHTPLTSKIRFVSPEIPAFGWRTLWVRGASVPEKAQIKVNPLIKPLLPLAMRLAQSKLGEKFLARLTAGDENKPPYLIENEFFLVEANPGDGTLTITDKQTNAVYKGLHRFVNGGDGGDEYNYSPPITDSFFTPKVVSLKVFRHKLVKSIEVKSELTIPAQLSADRKSRSGETVRIPIHGRISLVPGVARIDVHTELENLAKDHRLRVHFPAPFAVEEADHDGHFEVVRRPVGVPEKGQDWVESPRPEVPQRAFSDISNGEIGLMIANRGLPEVEVLKTVNGTHTEIALTLLRSVGWLSRDDLPVRQGHAGPALETPGGQVPGKWAYDYAVIPHRGTWRDAYLQAYAFETSLRAVTTDLHQGEITNQGSFLSHTPANFVVSAIKESEDGEGWILRGYNITSEPIHIRIKPQVSFSYAGLVNLAEEEVGALPMGTDGSITVTASGHQIISIKFSGSTEP